MPLSSGASRRLVRWSRIRTLLGSAILTASLGLLVISGIFGKFLKPQPGGAPDLIWMYAAGRCWLQGRNPYNPTQINAAVESVQRYDNSGAFGYPPQSAALFVPLARLSWPSAKFCWVLLQLVALGTIVALTLHTLRERSADRGAMRLGTALLLAFIFANSNTLYIVWDGQTSLIFLAAAMAAWWFAQHKAYGAAGLALAMASMKPQQCVFVILWFALDRQWKTLAYAAAAITAFSIYPALQLGFPNVFEEWLKGIQVYSKYNGPANVQDLHSLLFSAGIQTPDLTIVGAALVVTLWALRSRFMKDDTLGILLALQLLFVVTHIYDYVGVIPLLASLWVYASLEPGLWVPAIFILVLFNMPLRFIELLHSKVLFNWRVIVLLIMMGMVSRLSVRHFQSHGE